MALPKINAQVSEKSLELRLQLPGEPPLDILAMLLEHSRHPVWDQRPSASGAPLLHGAVAWGCFAAVPFLMARGARLSDMDIDCDTVAQTALETGGEPLLALLRDMEAALERDPALAAACGRGEEMPEKPESIRRFCADAAAAAKHGKPGRESLPSPEAMLEAAIEATRQSLSEQ